MTPPRPKGKKESGLKHQKNPASATMNSDSQTKQIRKIAEDLFKNAHGSHGWEHTLRVVRLCEHIGSREGADMPVLKIAAYLHDIGRCEQDSSHGTICHARLGSQMARPIIKTLTLTDRQKNNIIHCVRSHRFRGDETPDSLEAMVLFDADKLDAIGAVGVARAYLFAGENGARLHNPLVRVEDTLPYSEEDTGYREFKLKLSKIKDRMLTVEGRRLAVGRHDFMNIFFQRFLDEHAGRC